MGNEEETKPKQKNSLSKLYGLINTNYNRKSELTKMIINIVLGIIITLAIINPIWEVFSKPASYQQVESLREEIRGLCIDQNCSKEVKDSLIKLTATMTGLSDDFFKRAELAENLGEEQEALFFYEVILEMNTSEKYGSSFWKKYIPLKFKSIDWRNDVETYNDLKNQCYNLYVERKNIDFLPCYILAKYQSATISDETDEYIELISLIDSSLDTNLSIKDISFSLWVKSSALRRLGETEEAISTINQAIDIDMENDKLYAFKALLLYENKDYNSSVGLLNEMFKKKAISIESFGEYDYYFYRTYLYLGIVELGKILDNSDFINIGCNQLYLITQDYQPYKDLFTGTLKVQNAEGEWVDFACNQQYMANFLRITSKMDVFSLTPFSAPLS